MAAIVEPFLRQWASGQKIFFRVIKCPVVCPFPGLEAIEHFPDRPWLPFAAQAHVLRAAYIQEAALPGAGEIHGMQVVGDGCLLWKLDGQCTDVIFSEL